MGVEIIFVAGGCREIFEKKQRVHRLHRFKFALGQIMVTIDELLNKSQYCDMQ